MLNCTNNITFLPRTIFTCTKQYHFLPLHDATSFPCATIRFFLSYKTHYIFVCPAIFFSTLSTILFSLVRHCSSTALYCLLAPSDTISSPYTTFFLHRTKFFLPVELTIFHMSRIFFRHTKHYLICPMCFFSLPYCVY